MKNVQIAGTETASALTPAPFTTLKIILIKQEHIQLKQQANQWHAMWKAACDREQKVRSEITEPIELWGSVNFYLLSCYHAEAGKSTLYTDCRLVRVFATPSLVGGACHYKVLVKWPCDSSQVTACNKQASQYGQLSANIQK